MNIDPKAIRTPVHTDLQLMGYVRSPIHPMIEAMKAKRHERANSVALVEALGTNRQNLFR